MPSSNAPSAPPDRRPRTLVPRALGLSALIMVATLPCQQRAASAPPAVRITAEGIGALRLSAPLREAAELMRGVDPAAAMIGPGCDERDQISVVLQVAGVDLSVMAMAASSGTIEEVIAVPVESAGTPMPDAEACRRHGSSFASRFALSVGAVQGWNLRENPVATEYVFPFHPDARVIARWFSGARTCDLMLQFGEKGPVD